MELKALLADDDAVSPVIGVILMVAITVILAAVIGSFVLGLGNQVSEAQPNPTVSFNYTNSTGDYTSVGLTHDGGDSLDQDNLNISIAGDVKWSEGDIPTDYNDEWTIHENWNKSAISATDKIVIFDKAPTANEFGQGDDVNLVWTSSSGDTAVLAENTIN
jgi:flagellin-like protein